MPVLPVVPSIMVMPDRKLPRRSASETRNGKMRSLTLPLGLKYSTLATMVGFTSPTTRRRRTIGVMPAVSRIVSAICARRFQSTMKNASSILYWNNQYRPVKKRLALQLQQRTINRIDSWATGEGHIKLEFVTQQLEDMAHAFRAVDGKPPQDRAAKQHCSRSQGQGFQNIGAATYATIQVDFAASVNRFNDFGQGFDARNSCIKLSPAVIGDNDAIDAMLNRQYSVLRCQNALQDDWQRGDGA